MPPKTNFEAKMAAIVQYIDWFFSMRNTRLIKSLTKEWKVTVQKTFTRRKWMGLPTSNRLQSAIYFSENPEDGLRYDFKALSRAVPNATGGRCTDYVAILNTGFAGGKASMGKWMSHSMTGRKIDAQLFDLEGNPIGTHPGMSPKLPAAIMLFQANAEKIIVQQYREGLNKIMRV